MPTTAEQEAMSLFDVRFRGHMKNGNIHSFKEQYRTLYYDVAIPVIAKLIVEQYEILMALKLVVERIEDQDQSTSARHVLDKYMKDGEG